MVFQSWKCWIICSEMSYKDDGKKQLGMSRGDDCDM
jgi:hypothetical protein